MARPVFVKFVNLVMAIATSRTPAVDIGDYNLVGVICPAAIEATSTNLSIWASSTLAGTYAKVKPDGVAYTPPFAVDDYLTIANPEKFYALRFIKLQVETGAGVAVAQATAARTFVLILQ